MNRVHPTDGSPLTATANGFRTKQRPTHDGVDLRAPKGTPIKAAADGVAAVVLLDHPTAGMYVQLDHGSGTITGYSHLSRIDVERGQRVKAGDVLGLAGATGNAKGSHLHFGVKVSGKWVDPLAWIAAGSAKPSTPAPSNVLRFGSTGPKVKELQRVLNAWYPHRRQLVVDGIFGHLTEQAVKYLQQRAGLVVDGIAGPITLGYLGIKL